MNRIVSLLALFFFAGTFSAGAQSTFLLGPYDYDGSGNVIGVGMDALYRYDPYGRLSTSLIYANGTPHAQQFSYDRFGNITAVETDGTQIVLGVDAATNRLVQTSTSGIYGAYDVDGNMTAYTDSMTFTTDELGMVRRGTVDGQTKVYLYTAADERIAAIGVTGPSQAETNSTWTLRDPSGKVLRTYQKTLPGGERWQWKEDHIYRAGALLAADVPTAEGTRRHFHADHLGTPRLITDAHGVKVSEHTYAAFGLELTAAGPERMKFTGHERDTPNLDYMHARYYMPGGGRFLTVDPGEDQEPRQPQSWNMYAYVRNNPVNTTDPDGREGVGALVGAVIGYVGGAIDEVHNQGWGWQRPVDYSKVNNAALGGAASGLITGACTCPAALSGAAGGVIGGTLTRTLNKEQLSETKITTVAVDAVGGAVGAVAGQAAGSKLAARGTDSLKMKAAALRADSLANNQGLGADKMVQQQIKAATVVGQQTGDAVAGTITGLVQSSAQKEPKKQ